MNGPPNPLYFLIAFPLLWFAVTMILSFLSGWFGLMERYPDRGEMPVVTLANQSGSLGLVSMRGVLKLSVCPSGLRIGIMRIFGPFCRDFLVPWNEIAVTRSDRVFWKVAKLSFGNPSNGSLKVFAEVADRMARAAGSQWPEPGSFPQETASQSLSRIAKQWVGMTGLAAAFFIIAPRLMTPHAAARPPIVVAILFPPSCWVSGRRFSTFAGSDHRSATTPTAQCPVWMSAWGRCRPSCRSTPKSPRASRRSRIFVQPVRWLYFWRMSINAKSFRLAGVVAIVMAATFLIAIGRTKPWV